MQRALRPLGVAAAPHDPPRALAARVRERLGAAGEPLAALLEALEAQRYGRAAGAPPRPALTRALRRSRRAACGRARPDNRRRHDSPTAAIARSAAMSRRRRSCSARCLADRRQRRRGDQARQGAARPKNGRAVDDARPTSSPTAGATTSMRFADEVAERRGLDPTGCAAQLGAGALSARASTRCIMPPPAGTAKNWAAYRARFVEPLRIRAGVRVLARQRSAGCAQAEERYGVPPEIVVGIVGVETDLRPADGRLPRHRRAGDAGLRLPERPQGPQRLLPRRARGSWFVLCRQRRRRPAQRWRGSYAGAHGHAAVHAEQHQQATRSTSTATATSTCTPAPPT